MYCRILLSSSDFHSSCTIDRNTGGRGGEEKRGKKRRWHSCILFGSGCVWRSRAMNSAVPAAWHLNHTVSISAQSSINWAVRYWSSLAYQLLSSEASLTSIPPSGALPPYKPHTPLLIMPPVSKPPPPFLPSLPPLILSNTILVQVVYWQGHFRFKTNAGILSRFHYGHSNSK